MLGRVCFICRKQSPLEDLEEIENRVTGRKIGYICKGCARKLEGGKQ